MASDRRDLFGTEDNWDYGWWYTPQFSSCIWVKRVADMTLAPPIEAWLPSSQLETYKAEGPVRPRRPRGLAAGAPERRAHHLPRRDGQEHRDDVAQRASPGWPTTCPSRRRSTKSPIITSWPDDFATDYYNDVVTMDGEVPAVFPVSDRVESFTVKNNALWPNDLEENFQYLEERYQVMGIETRRQSFVWRDMPQMNLIAEIPGSDPSLDPVLMADHIDTAFDEDRIFTQLQFIAVPGADDNSSASAALLRAAETLKDSHPVRTIWLVHFTGEEFPADDLGARQLVSQMLGDGQDIAGLVLLDLIGYAGVGESQFQINPGQHAASIEMGRVALDAAADQAPDLTPLLRAALLDPQLPVQHRRDHLLRERLSRRVHQRAPQLLHEAHEGRLPRHERHVGQDELRLRREAHQDLDRDGGAAGGRAGAVRRGGAGRTHPARPRRHAGVRGGGSPMWPPRHYGSERRRAIRRDRAAAPGDERRFGRRLARRPPVRPLARLTVHGRGQ